MADEDDVTALLALDDDQDENVVSYFPSTEDAEEGRKVGGNAREEYEEELRQIRQEREALEAQIAALKTAPVPRNDYSAQQQPAPAPNIFPNSGNVDRQAMVAQLEQLYITNPGEAMLKIYEASQQAAEAAIRKSMYPVAGQQTRFAIDQYKQNAKFLPDEEQEFNKLVSQINPEALATADPNTLADHLKVLKAAAKGFALEARQSTPQPRVPTYSTGSTSGGSGGRGKAVQRKLTPAQKIIWDTGIENGMSPKEILEAIDSED